MTKKVKYFKGNDKNQMLAKGYLGAPCRARSLRYDDSTDWPLTSHVTTVESTTSHPVTALQKSSTAEPERREWLLGH